MIRCSSINCIISIKGCGALVRIAGQSGITSHPSVVQYQNRPVAIDGSVFICGGQSKSVVAGYFSFVWVVADWASGWSPVSSGRFRVSIGRRAIPRDSN